MAWASKHRELVLSIAAFAVMVLFLVICVFAQSSTVRVVQYAPERISLQGRLEIRDRFGPPNYGDTPDEDSIETWPVLVLERPISTIGDPKSDLNRESFSNLGEVQMIVTGNIFSRHFVGKRIRVFGSLVTGHTGHHFTKVVIDAESIEVLPEPQGFLEKTE